MLVVWKVREENEVHGKETGHLRDVLEVPHTILFETEIIMKNGEWQTQDESRLNEIKAILEEMKEKNRKEFWPTVETIRRKDR